MKKLALLLIFTYVCVSSQAQSLSLMNNADFLAYYRISDTTQELVYWISGAQFTYYLLEDECISLSDDGRYLALSSEQSQTLKFIYFPTRKTIYEHTWGDNFRHCGFSWRSKNVISLDIIDTGITDPYFKFDSITLIEFPIPPSQQIYPDLPNYFPESSNNLILRNPTNLNIYLYEKCPSGEIYSGGCGNAPKAVIYNIENNTEMEELEGAVLSYMRGNAYESTINCAEFLCPITGQLVSWSQDGRYVAYPTYSYIGNRIPEENEIIIYDMQTDRYIHAYDALYLANINRNFQWSSNNVLLVWQTRPFMEGYSYHSSLTFFSFFYADTQTSVTGDKPFDVLSQHATFAPDGRAIAFIGKALDTFEYPDFGSDPRRGDLVIMSTTTGESTVIDTDVTEIVTWRSICDFTPLDTASLISTMQTEPYSVICLSENGQYDLNAPLPDVAGDITIIGNGATITMTGEGRVFNVIYNQQWSRNGSLMLKNVTVSGGNATEGGAIFNAGELTLENAILENNSAVRGGAIYNAGVLTMNGGAIQNNVASEFGGGIYNVGEMTLDGVNITENDAPEGSGVYQGG